MQLQNFLYAGDSAPRPPCLQRLGALPQTPNTHSHITNFWLRARCFYCCYVILCKLILRLAGVYGFPQGGVSLNKFAHPLFKPRRRLRRKGRRMLRRFSVKNKYVQFNDMQITLKLRRTPNQKTSNFNCNQLTVQMHKSIIKTHC